MAFNTRVGQACPIDDCLKFPVDILDVNIWRFNDHHQKCVYLLSMFFNTVYYLFIFFCLKASLLKM